LNVELYPAPRYDPRYDALIRQAVANYAPSEVP